MLEITSPRPYQVYQRNDDYVGDITVAGTVDGSGAVEYRLSDSGWQKADVRDGRFAGIVKDVPVGGPYTIEIRMRGSAVRRIPGILVGDLWILAGQSNMDGCGKLINLEAPSRMVNAFYYDETWGVARDPLCWVFESIDPVHWVSQDPVERENFNRFNRAFRDAGAGLGVRFAKDLYKATGVPVGLLVCSHGGTSLEQWSPKLKSEGGKSLYGSMIRRVIAAGSRVAGCLWYQGESDACGPKQGVGYKDGFRFLIESIRKDLTSPRMPFIYVQLGPFFADDAALRDGWNRVQNDQLAIESEMPNLAMVPAIDSTLSDAIHADAVSMKRIGARMALMARRLRFGEKEVPSGPRPVACSFADGTRSRISVKYSGVNGKLRPSSGIWGFLIEADAAPRAISKCALDRSDPTRVIITLAEPAPEGSVLWYGRGINPTCNLSDSAGFPAPVFGPVAL